MEEGFREFMARNQRAFTDDEFGVAEFVTRNRMRNRTGPNPLKVYANDVAPFTPGLSRGVWAVTAPIPFAVKAGFTLYLELFRKHFPDLVWLPFCSDGNLYKTSGAFNKEYSLIKFRGWMMDQYYVGQLARRLGWRPVLAGETHDTIGRAIRAADLEHPDLNADGIASLLKGEGGNGNPTTRIASTWLFYWQMWRGVMDGSLRARQAEEIAGAPR
jgi:hypothetical protein